MRPRLDAEMLVYVGIRDPYANGALISTSIAESPHLVQRSPLYMAGGASVAFATNKVRAMKVESCLTVKHRTRDVGTRGQCN